MSGNYKFFENKNCEFYPCHDLKEINCLFCFCPVFDWCINRECKNCSYPHKREDYDKVIKRLGR